MNKSDAIILKKLLYVVANKPDIVVSSIGDNFTPDGLRDKFLDTYTKNEIALFCMPEAFFGLSNEILLDLAVKYPVFLYQLKIIDDKIYYKILPLLTLTDQKRIAKSKPEIGKMIKTDKSLLIPTPVTTNTEDC